MKMVNMGMHGVLIYRIIGLLPCLVEPGLGWQSPALPDQEPHL